MINLKILCDPTLVPDTALYLSKVAEKYGVTERKAHMICFVVETILEMRMQEANQNDPYIFLEVKKEADEILISITDKGVPYVLTDYQKMILKRGLVDRFFFEHMGVKGQKITVAFKRSTEQIHPMVVSAADNEEVWQNSDFTCRPTKEEDEDIVQAIRCIYTSYGYNYIHQELYNVDIFKDMLKSGRYISALAENADHQIAGHIAIEEHRWFPGIMEICNLVVKPGIRGKAISRLLVDSVISMGRQQNLSGLYSMPVMYHPVSQRLSTAHGFYPCGMYFHLLGEKASSEYRDGSNRLNAAFAVHIYDKTTDHVLYLPEECAEFVINVFEKEQMNYSIGTEAANPPAETVLSYNIEAVSKRLEIKIDRAGDDLEEHLSGLLSRGESEMVEVVMVYLNANDPGCPDCYRYLRERGLIFTGCLPGSRGNDYILLQHLKGRSVTNDKIVAEPDYQEMLDCIFRINGIK